MLDAAKIPVCSVVNTDVGDLSAWSSCATAGSMQKSDKRRSCQGSPQVPSGTEQFVVADLMFLLAKVRIDEEMFVSVLRYENTHRNFAPCPDCRATTLSQHDPSCRRVVCFGYQTGLRSYRPVNAMLIQRFFPVRPPRIARCYLRLCLEPAWSRVTSVLEAIPPMAAFGPRNWMISTF